MANNILFRILVFAARFCVECRLFICMNSHWNGSVYLSISQSPSTVDVVSEPAEAILHTIYNGHPYASVFGCAVTTAKTEEIKFGNTQRRYIQRIHRAQTTEENPDKIHFNRFGSHEWVEEAALTDTRIHFAWRIVWVCMERRVWVLIEYCRRHNIGPFVCECVHVVDVNRQSKAKMMMPDNNGMEIDETLNVELKSLLWCHRT